MEQLAYEEAAELYERALEVLELEDELDERRALRAAAGLGGAQTSAGAVSDARKAFERAAESARRLGRRGRPGRRRDRDRDAERGRPDSTSGSSR